MLHVTSGDVVTGRLRPAGLFRDREEVTAEQAAVASRAWEDSCAPEPLALQALPGLDPLAFLPGAVRRHLQELPGLRTAACTSPAPNRPGAGIRSRIWSAARP